MTSPSLSLNPPYHLAQSILPNSSTITLNPNTPINKIHLIYQPNHSAKPPFHPPHHILSNYTTLHLQLAYLNSIPQLQTLFELVKHLDR